MIVVYFTGRGGLTLHLGTQCRQPVKLRKKFIMFEVSTHIDQTLSHVVYVFLLFPNLMNLSQKSDFQKLVVGITPPKSGDTSTPGPG